MSGSYCPKLSTIHPTVNEEKIGFYEVSFGKNEKIGTIIGIFMKQIENRIKDS
jgi:hypothetical protein